MAKEIPVLPLVASTTTEPARSTPERSAASIMASAGRSFTLPPGFFNSSFPATVAPRSELERRDSSTSGVRPTWSSRLPTMVQQYASKDALVDFDRVSGLKRYITQLAVGDVVDAHRGGHRPVRRDQARNPHMVAIGNRGHSPRERNG